MNKSVPFYALRYAMYYVLIIAIVMALIYGIYAVAPALAASVLEGGGSTGLNMVSVILPPLLIAQLFYRHEQRSMGRRESWGFAALFTVLGLVLGVLAAVLATVAVPLTSDERDAFTYLLSERSALVMSVLAVVLVFLLLTNKLMMWSGFRGAAKVAAKEAAKVASDG